MGSNNDPTVGVVIPTYNDEDFLQEAIESVLRQTYPPSQIVITDDASSDHTTEIINEYEKEYPHIIEAICHSQNRGAASNFNSGIKAISQDYITLLAGDDFWDPMKIELEVDHLISSNEARWAYSRYAAIDKDGRYVHVSQPKFNDSSLDVLLEALANHMVIRSWLAEAQLIKKIGYFDESLPVSEDWDFKIRLAVNAKAVHVPRITVYYRGNPSGLSRTVSPSVFKSSMNYVYHKHEGIIRRLPPKQYSEIVKRQRKNLARLEIRKLLDEDGQKTKAFMKSIAMLVKNPSSVRFWKLYLRVIAPRYIYELMRRTTRFTRHFVNINSRLKE